MLAATELPESRARDRCYRAIPAFDGCPVCVTHVKHMDHAKEARLHYRADADRDWSPDELAISADMMNVIAVPIIPIKEAIFNPRLV